ncbi:hypothetical protein [Streptomyces violaceusniger]|uniref:Uncharacterized protein n=1 Tax=Streptomyces violaceusniger (strain Tu 4113) TaxID=653045 RepID=G2PAW3_STRV4|nr:hypothetical protein [Streptomyces violaceusniger]AEM88139.1 hypothetical protein Strvi_8837 [Streptomyces violaceusniger Tu 4113]
MTARRDHHHGCNLDRLHRDEITVAMNWVIRTCQDIIRAHSHKTFWVPSGTATGAAPTTDHLIESARADVLGKLRRHIDGAESIISSAEQERAKHQR